MAGQVIEVHTTRGPANDRRGEISAIHILQMIFPVLKTKVCALALFMELSVTKTPEHHFTKRA